MTTKELRELDAWVCKHSMGWMECKTLKSLDHAKRFCVHGDDVFIHAHGNHIKNFHPSTDPAAAIQVLEKCVSKTLFVRISDASVSVVKRFIVTGDGGMTTSAETLPLAICLFAKKLFAKKD